MFIITYHREYKFLGSVQFLCPWTACLSSLAFFFSLSPYPLTSYPSSHPLALLSGASLIFCVTILTQHFLSLSSVSAPSYP